MRLAPGLDLRLRSSTQPKATAASKSAPPVARSVHEPAEATGGGTTGRGGGRRAGALASTVAGGLVGGTGVAAGICSTARSLRTIAAGAAAEVAGGGAGCVWTGAAETTAGAGAVGGAAAGGGLATGAAGATKGGSALGRAAGLATAGEMGTDGAAFVAGVDTVGPAARSVGGVTAGALLRAGLIQINGAGETFVGLTFLRIASSISETDIGFGLLVAVAEALA